MKKVEKLYLETFREIRSYIINNGLKPGDMLPTEQAMCERWGVSRNVLREAIKSMELMGMVQACPGRGTQVKDFNLDFIFQNVLFFNMGDPEGRARARDVRHSQNADWATSSGVQGAQRRRHRLYAQCAGNIRESWENTGAFSEADREFHMALFRPLKNEVLNSLMEAIWSVDRGFQLERKSPHLAYSVTKHEAIVDALEHYDYRAFAHDGSAFFFRQIPDERFLRRVLTHKEGTTMTKKNCLL
ncbi:MAG: FadR/GntR family transcriptional regulator [Christensenellales bacterium]